MKTNQDLGVFNQKKNKTFTK